MTNYYDLSKGYKKPSLIKRILQHKDTPTVIVVLSATALFMGGMSSILKLAEYAPRPNLPATQINSVVRGEIISEAQIPQNISVREQSRHPYWIQVQTPNHQIVKINFDTPQNFFYTQGIDDGSGFFFQPVHRRQYEGRALELDRRLNVGDKVEISTYEFYGISRSASEIINVEKNIQKLFEYNTRYEFDNKEIPQYGPFKKEEKKIFELVPSNSPNNSTESGSETAPLENRMQGESDIESTKLPEFKSLKELAKDVLSKLNNRYPINSNTETAPIDSSIEIAPIESRVKTKNE